MGSFDKQEFQRCLKAEVYSCKRGYFLNHFIATSFLLGKNANYLIRKIQLNHSEPSITLRYFKMKFYMLLLMKRFGCIVGSDSEIGSGLQLPHPTGIIIGKGVVIGENCCIYQQVTLGGRNKGDSKKKAMPQIGNDCVLYAGCKILGNVKVADGTIIGANSVLTVDTVPYGIYGGAPAKFIKLREDAQNASST